MKVIDIEFDKKRDLFLVYFENNNKFFINYNIFEKYKISKDMEFTEEEILEMKYYSDFERAKIKALKYVSGKFKTKMEVRKKLKEEFQNDVIEDVLYFLEENGYIDDRNYTKLFIEDKQKLNGYGKNKIKSLLIQKGIEKNIIDEFIFDVDDDFEFSNALNVGIKKLNLLENEKDKFKKKQKIINYLAYRGFSFDIIQKVLGEIL